MKLLLLDNHDSFTYNLVHLIEKVSDADVTVRLNDQLDLHEAGTFDRIVLSPGPGLPSEAGIMPEVIRTYASSIPMFGVCLGMQAIAEYCGNPLRNLPEVCHGIATPVHPLNNDPLFENCPGTFMAARYHSWVVDERLSLQHIHVIAVDDQNTIMAIRHNSLALCGVQFHPEAILSECGETILSNWIHG